MKTENINTNTNNENIEANNLKVLRHFSDDVGVSTDDLELNEENKSLVNSYDLKHDSNCIKDEFIKPIKFADFLEEKRIENTLGRKKVRNEACTSLISNNYLSKNKKRKMNDNFEENYENSVFSSLYGRLTKLTLELNQTRNIQKSKDILEAMKLCLTNLQMLKNM